MMNNLRMMMSANSLAPDGATSYGVEVAGKPLASALFGILAHVGVYALAMFLFFRVPILSGFDLGFGERGDGVIEISILEHWRNVFSGISQWQSSFYFHPYSNTLGYNDGYFLYGVVYSLWRNLVDPFHADTLNILTFKTIGYVGSYLLVSRTLGWGRQLGLLIALLFTVASNISLQAWHAQLQSVALLPVAFILAISMVRAEECGSMLRARLLAIALSALMASWLLTSYYMAWFTIFSGCLYVASWMMLSQHWGPNALVRFIRSHIMTLAIGMGSFLILIVPFLLVYLPKMKETGGEDYHDMLGYLVTPVIDMINVGPQNYMWGWIFEPLLALAHMLFPHDPGLPSRVLRGEHEAGFPLIMFMLVVVSLWKVVFKRRLADGSPPSVPLRSFAVAMTIAWLLTLQLWVASPWVLVFEFVPGAKGMRAVSRYQLWLTLPFLILVAAVWRTRFSGLMQRAPMAASGIALVLVAENLSAETAAQLSRTEQRAALWTIPSPPEQCSVFYVTVSRPGEPLYINRHMDDRYPHNVDAMLLSELWRLPTVNGFSTFNPPDWNFAAPLAADYDARVASYASRHQLRGLCRLDTRQQLPWTLMDPVNRRTPASLQ